MFVTVILVEKSPFSLAKLRLVSLHFYNPGCAVGLHFTTSARPTIAPNLQHCDLYIR